MAISSSMPVMAAMTAGSGVTFDSGCSCAISRSVAGRAEAQAIVQFPGAPVECLLEPGSGQCRIGIAICWCCAGAAGAEAMPNGISATATKASRRSRSDRIAGQ